MNLKLTEDGDLDVSSNGIALVNGSDEIAQKLFVRLQFFRGEWFLDIRLGIPYFEDIFVKNPDLITVKSIFREAILETPGVDTMDDFELVFNSSERKLSMSFTVNTITGETINFDREFLIG